MISWRIIAGLQQHAGGSLEYLEIVDKAERLSWLCETDDIGRIGALCEFKVLRKIKVDYDMFLHRHLTVEDMEERV